MMEKFLLLPVAEGDNQRRTQLARNVSQSSGIVTSSGNYDVITSFLNSGPASSLHDLVNYRSGLRGHRSLGWLACACDADMNA